jgi:hypothetical protein
MMKNIFITVIAIIAFTGAFFEIFHGGGVLQELLIAVLAFTMVTMKKQITISRQGLAIVWPFISYTLIATLSALTYSNSVFYTLAAIHSLLFCLIIYFWMSNLCLDDNRLKALRKLVYFIAFSQFVFVLIKFAVHGIDEKFLIGTMSNAAGQLGFLFPAVIIPLLIFMRRSDNIFISYALVAAMFLFGIINEKRVVVFSFPLIILASLVVDLEGSFLRSRDFRGNLLIGVLLGLTGFIIGIHMIPSLNPEEVFGGPISLSHVYKYTIEYSTMDFGGTLQGSYEEAVNNTKIQVGRITLWRSIIEWLSLVDTKTVLFGTGFGSATPSIWLTEDSDLLFGIIGTRGSISAGGLALIETGIVGFLAIGYWFVHIFWKLIIIYRQAHSLTARRWFRLIMLVHFIFCFDFFYYSTSLLRTFPMPLIFFGFITSIFIVKSKDKDFLLDETLKSFSTSHSA